MKFTHIKPGEEEIHNGLNLVDEIAEPFLEQLRRVNDSSSEGLAPRHYTLAESAKMVPCSEPTFRRSISTILGKREEIDGKRTGIRRSFTLHTINEVRRKQGKAVAGTLRKGVTLVYANYKGGVSKTTSATISAHYFSKKGYRVLLVDLDPQGSLSQAFGYRPSIDLDYDETIGGIIDGSKSSEYIHNIVRETHWDQLYLIPAGVFLHDVEFRVSAGRVSEEFKPKVNIPPPLRLREALRKVQEKFDIVIIDCPPALNWLTLNGVLSATNLIIPIPPHSLDIESTFQFVLALNSFLATIADSINTRGATALSAKVLFQPTLVDQRSDSDLRLVTALRAALPSLVSPEDFLISEAIKRAGASFQSPYEIERYEGSRTTFQRCIENLDRVFGYIEKTILITHGAPRVSETL